MLTIVLEQKAAGPWAMRVEGGPGDAQPSPARIAQVLATLAAKLLEKTVSAEPPPSAIVLPNAIGQG